MSFYLKLKESQTTPKDHIKDVGPLSHLILKFTILSLYKESHMRGGRRNLGLRVITRKEIEDWLLIHGRD